MMSICAHPGVRDLDQLKNLKTTFGLFKILLFSHLCQIIPEIFK